MRFTSLFISILGHITVFSIFSFSFGGRIPSVNFAQVSFYGTILSEADLSRSFNHQDTKVAAMRKSNLLALAKTDYRPYLVRRDYLKPPVNLLLSEVNPLTYNIGEGVKQVSMGLNFSNPLKRKEPIIMFYPHLPYHFTLYFKDRQAVHIELMFNITPCGSKKNSITLKRKISSGNLEADLLTMRYISRYLFIQQMGFIPNNWQTVKIDLSTVND